jgi:hypothetical protein
MCPWRSREGHTRDIRKNSHLIHRPNCMIHYHPNTQHPTSWKVASSDGDTLRVDLVDLDIAHAASRVVNRPEETAVVAHTGLRYSLSRFLGRPHGELALVRPIVGPLSSHPASWFQPARFRIRNKSFHTPDASHRSQSRSFLFGYFVRADHPPRSPVRNSYDSFCINCMSTVSKRKF